MLKISEENINAAKKKYDEYIINNRIITKIENFLDELIQNNCSKNIKEKLKYIKENICNILNADISTMNRYNNDLVDIISILKNIQKEKIKAENFNDDQRIAKDLANEFIRFYENFSKNKDYSYGIIKALGIKSCPYCNIGYAYAVIDYKNQQYLIRPHFDHYYEKSIYPYFAMSFYNLVPSCPACNSSLKSNKDFRPIHPYYKSLDSMMNFIIKINNFKYLYTDEESFDIELNYNNSAKKHIKQFKLKERYKYHKDIVRELLIKKKCFSSEYKNNLIIFLKKNGIYANEDYVNLLITGNYTNTENINQRPLAK